MHTTADHPTKALTEADRLMVVCNSCRYCEGLCAVFPAMEQRRLFTDGDLNYLANLCHGCGACFADCQFSPPHEFEVNVPRALAEVRGDTYAHYAWPPVMSGFFNRNALLISILLAVSIAGFATGFAVLSDPKLLTGASSSEGSFYRLMPHNAMAGLFGAAFLYALFAIYLSCSAFWRDISKNSEPVTIKDFVQAVKDAGQLRYLDGGKAGCMNDSDEPTDMRKHFHHATFYGFLLCFAATSVATIYHYVLGRQAPYPWWDLPVVLGSLGGVGLIVGPIGLIAAKFKRAPELVDRPRMSMDIAFTAMLLLTSVTGFALICLRSTSFMGIALSIHLGVVLTLFLTLPYSKFLHGFFRFLALVQYSRETRSTH